MAALLTARFNVQKFYVVLLRLWFLYECQNKQRLLSYATLTDWFRITDVEIVYYAVRTEALLKTIFVFKVLVWVQWRLLLKNEL